MPELADLHSNMVRFIILSEDDDNVVSIANLHSNMVRFIINPRASKVIVYKKFTFQYG